MRSVEWWTIGTAKSAPAWLHDSRKPSKLDTIAAKHLVRRPQKRKGDECYLHRLLDLLTTNTFKAFFVQNRGYNLKAVAELCFALPHTKAVCARSRCINGSISGELHDLQQFHFFCT